MKYHGSYCEHEQERNNDLIRVYRQKCDEATIIRNDEIYALVVNSPSKRFWVSEERAAIVLSEMMKGKPLSIKGRCKQEMFLEIYRRAMVLREQYPAMTIKEIAFRVVHQPAPKFYLTPDSAKIIVSKIKREWYQKRKQKLRHLF